jgi:S-DNA-T family DNA segregation ATPase FtsK/SpoIIIE
MYMSMEAVIADIISSAVPREPPGGFVLRLPGFLKLLHIPPRFELSKIRRITLLCALGFGAAGMFLGFSISSALFDLGGILSGPGYFFVRSYGALAFIIPAYLISAAFLLVDPRYRPDRIFLLSGITAPFITIALGLYWIRGFEALSARIGFFAFWGKTGIGFTVMILAILEGIGLIKLRSLFFGGVKPGAAPPRTSARKEAARFLPLPGTGAENLPALIPQRKRPERGGLPAEAVYEEAPARPTGVLNAPDDVAQALAEAEAAAAVREAQVHEAEALTKQSAAQRKKRKAPYTVPVEDILNQYPDGEYWIIDDATRNAAMVLKDTLREFKIQAEVTGIKKGPVITMFEILPAPGVRLSKIVGLQDNIALRLAASSVRIVAPIPGKHAVGIEVPNAKRSIVSFREIIGGELNKEGKRPEIPVILGKDIMGEAVTADLASMPHLLIAGATGSGKSVCVNALILSILYQKPPSECRLILIDPKIVELKLYNDIPHLLTPVITESKKAFQALQYCIYEMERRYACLDSQGVRDIKSYNKRIKERDLAAEFLPYIVVVIDEFADLMATTGKELESTVARLAAMSRAVGVHLVLATQRPSINVITGLIKANIPSRIAFMVASMMDSRIIIDMPGAEKLLGKGDMLYAGAVDPFPIRMQGAFVSEEEVEKVVEHVKTLGEPDYIDDEIFYEDEDEAEPSLFSEGGDPLYDKALEIVMSQGKASASYIQRRLKIGYNRAARLVEEMEQRGIVGAAQGSRPRELLRGA